VSLLSALPTWAKDLPMHGELERLLNALASHRAAIVVAPPGCGKSLLAPLKVLEALRETDQQVWLLEPRRLAARAVARTLASLVGEPLGKTVGYKVRFDELGGTDTRLWVVTEGIFGRRVEQDPLLEGIGCVILDEVHERSLHTDLALGFLKEISAARDDLWILAMSATIDPAPLAAYWNHCPVIQGNARAFPMEIDYQDRSDERPLEERICAAVRGLIRRRDDDGGDVLVFLPGAPQIHRCLERLQSCPLPGAPVIVPLYGGLPAKEQDRALLPQGARRIVLATNIAQTSLTVPRVTAVVDSGLAKTATFDPCTGLDRLVLGRIAKDAADQRAGRAGRIAKGRVIRLWTAAEHQGLASHTAPELQRIDLCSAVLQVLSFCPAGLSAFPFFEAPPQGPLRAALELLQALGAIDERERLSTLGRRMLRLPAHPRIAAAVLGCDPSKRARAALCAALLEPRDILARPQVVVPMDDCDLAHRASLLARLADSPRTAREALALGLLPGPAFEAVKSADQLRGDARVRPYGCEITCAVGALLLPGFVDRVCRRRAPGSPEAVMVGGRGFRLSADSAVTQAELFIALDADAGLRGERSTGTIRAASRIEREDLERLSSGALRWESLVKFDEQRQAVSAVEQLVFRDLVLEERRPRSVDEGAMASCLASEARRRFASVFTPTKGAIVLRQRIAFGRLALPEADLPVASDEALCEWLAELCMGLRSFDDVRRIDWESAILARLSFAARALLDREIPERLEVPSGLWHPIDYEAASRGGAPVLAVKLQEMFGCADTPRIAKGRVPLLLHLLSPSGRPAQITSDLRGFWNGAYALVRKELAGRYPKHPWPQDPWTALPTARTKPRGQPR
jgi:ATP-dependent helicase HrpB